MSEAASLLIVIPCLNEAAHLPALLDYLRADPAARDARIVVADGGSTDKSRAIVSAYAEQDPRVILLPNEKRIQSAAVNLAVRTYGDASPRFVRIDAHGAYPADFLSRLREAQTESGAASVVIAMRAKAHTQSCFQKANAAAQNSILGAGGSAHRKSGARRFVDHGHHALFVTETFRAAGGYDESFTHNEDAELDVRLAALGGRILLAGDIVMDYFPRAEARALWRQYYMFGRGRAKNVRKHKLTLKARQALPLIIAPITLLALAAPLWLWAGLPFAAYAVLCLSFGLMLGVRAKSLCAAAAGLPALIMHAAWSAGYWRETLFPQR
jgi:succinoglycan biosynthesis protein ExoA